MVDAPWLSPREHSGAFFIFGHWVLLLSLILYTDAINRVSTPVPHTPSPLDGDTSGKGRLIK